MTVVDQDRPLGDKNHLGDLPPSLPSLWRTVRIGYRAEPRLLAVSFLMTVVAALPDALMALWLALLTQGVLDGDRTRIYAAAAGVAVSAVGMWFLGVVLERVSRRFRDRIGIALETHVASLQARIGTIEHHERPDYLDRLSVLRDQVFALDHLFMSLFSITGWIVRLVITLALLGSIHPALLLLGLFGLPMLATAAWRPGVERRVEEEVAAHNRLARHLFVMGTTASPGKEVRLQGLGPDLIERRAAAWQRWWRPVWRTQVVSAGWAAAALTAAATRSRSGRAAAPCTRTRSTGPKRSTAMPGRPSASPCTSLIASVPPGTRSASPSRRATARATRASTLGARRGSSSPAAHTRAARASPPSIRASPTAPSPPRARRRTSVPGAKRPASPVSASRNTHGWPRASARTVSFETSRSPASSGAAAGKIRQAGQPSSADVRTSRTGPPQSTPPRTRSPITGRPASAAHARTRSASSSTSSGASKRTVATPERSDSTLQRKPDSPAGQAGAGRSPYQTGE